MTEEEKFKRTKNNEHGETRGEKGRKRESKREGKNYDYRNTSEL
jgi:hypothetical protein